MSGEYYSRALPRAVRSWLAVVLALALMIGAGEILVWLLMAPAISEMLRLAIVLSLAGGASLGAGWLMLWLADRTLGARMQTKAFLSACIGCGVTLLVIAALAQLMLLSPSRELSLLIALLLFGATVTLCCSLWVATTTVRRITAVASSIRALAAGDLTARVVLPGGDEVTQLAGDVNLLVSRLRSASVQQEALDRERTELTAAISHDLRTPLASMQVMAEALHDGMVDDPADVARYYAALLREIQHLSRVVDDLFVLAQIDAGALRLQPEPISLRRLAEEVVAAMQAQARRDGLSLTLRPADAPDLMVADAARLKRALTNLTQNALEHTSAGGRVEVAIATSTDDAVVLSISDSGAGIDPADLPHIWDRFYRAEKSRSRRADSVDGSGLGLAIVRGIVEAHGGAVRVNSQPGHGTTFTISLPVRSALRAHDRSMTP